MNIFVGLLLIFCLNLSLNIDQYILLKSQKIQSRCRTTISQNTIHHSEIMAALICGTPLSSTRQSELFKKSGLIHLIVVSGSHLILISNLAAFFLKRKHGFPLLALYAVLTGLQPPVFRALIQTAAAFEAEEQVYPIHPLAKELAALLAVVFLIPNYFFSLSLCLSSLCSLALLLTRKKNVFVQSTAVFFLLSPCLLLFSNPNFFSIFMNATVGVVLSATLLPLAILALLPGSFFSSLFSQIVSATLTSAEYLPVFDMAVTRWMSTRWITPSYFFILILLVYILLFFKMERHA